MRADLRHRLAQLAQRAAQKSAPQGARRVISPSATPCHTCYIQMCGRKNVIFTTRHTCHPCHTPKTTGEMEIEAADWLAHFDERAGVLQYDGGLSRAEAADRAHEETVAAIGSQPGTVH